MARLEEKVAVITGAAGDIGRALTGLFRDEGARVVASDLAAQPDSPRADLWCASDVTDEAAWQALITQAQDRFGRIDVLVNNAGVALAKSVEETSLEEWRAIMAVNLDGVFLGLKHGIGAMKRTGGSIVNLSSVAGLVAAPQLAAYAASKGAVRSLTRSAAIHCTDAGYPIRINAVLPGFTDGAMLDGIAEVLGRKDSIKAKLASRQPLGRLATTDEVARAVLYLASDEASYVTGSELVIDGGYSAR